MSILGSVLDYDASRRASKEQARAAGRASDAQVESAREALDFNLAALENINQQLMPQRQMGIQAMNTLADLYGYERVSLPDQSLRDIYGEIRAERNSEPEPQQTGGGMFGAARNAFAAQTARPYTAMPKPGAASVQYQGANVPAPEARRENALATIMNDPGFQFRLNQGQAALERSAAARGRLFGTETLANTNQLAQNMASQEFGNAFNRLAGLAGFGTAATSQGNAATQGAGATGAQLLTNMGNARASGFLGAGDARAAGILGRANAINSGMGDIESLLLMGGGA